MTVMLIPPPDRTPWPSLGEGVCRFIEENLVHGPGDLRGEPAVLDDEKRFLIWRMYEVYPKGHASEGRRRFRRCALSLRKGVAKTELAAWIAACELHPEAPVRFSHWDGDEPVGMGVTDPYIPLIAYTEEQSEELVYGALLSVLSEGPLADDFDLGLTRVVRLDGAGKAVPLAGAPGPRDGARTTFEVFDETHRMLLPRQKDAHRTMLANLPKRRIADPWALEVTTSFSPGEGSVAEETMDYAQAVADKSIADSKLFFFHRQASDSHDLEKPEGLRAAVIEASGPAAEWSDIDGIVEQWQDPGADTAFLERVWLNRPTKASERAFDVTRWRELADPSYRVAPRAQITLGFDGAKFHDSTALVGCEIDTGHLFLVGIWERPRNAVEWEVPAAEVSEVVEDAFQTWNVWRMYADPPYWDGIIDEWAGTYGDRVVAWWTNRRKQMAYALKAFQVAMASGDLSHSGARELESHIGNAARRELPMRDDEDRPLWMIQKERPDSPHKIDAAMAAVLAWEARGDAVAAGLLAPQPAWLL